MTLYTVKDSEAVREWHTSQDTNQGTVDTYYAVYHLQQDYYGASGSYDGYDVNKPFGDNHHYFITPLLVTTSDDIIHGSDNHYDYLYGGNGDDELHGNSDNDILVGGDNDDTIYGGHGDDRIFGDWSSVPEVNGTSPVATVNYNNISDEVKVDTWIPVSVVLDSDGNPTREDIYDSNGDFNDSDWSTYSQQDLTLTGDDLLYGGDGSDVIVAGPGNDFLSGGPRGGSSNPFTDDLNGGSGSDAFVLSYQETATDDPSASYWSAYAGTMIATQAGSVTKNVTTGLVKAGTQESLGAVGAGMLGGVVGGMAGALVTGGIEYLLSMNASAQAAPTNEDVMVVRDFNPSEDTLFLSFDLDDDTTLTATATYYVTSPVSSLDLSGWGISFASGADNTTYAEVFLDEAWLNDLGIPNSSSALTETAINNTLSTGINITPSGYADTTTIDPFGNEDPDPVALAAPSGSYTHVLGAYLPVSMVQPASSNGIHIGGTIMGDVQTVNDVAFPPNFYDTYKASGDVATDRGYIRGFAGDDVIFGGAGSDEIYGDEGDDLIWSFESGSDAGGSLPEQIFGGDGNDRMIGLDGEQFLDGGTGTDVMDGGEGTDTATYADAAQGVNINLTTGDGYDGDLTYAQFGEYGSVTFTGADTVDNPTIITFSQTYENPVLILGLAIDYADEFSPVVFKPIALDGSSATIGAFGFPDLSAEDDYTVDYLVVEAGAWEMEDGTVLAAGTTSTSSALGKPTSTSTIEQFSTNYYPTVFDQTPVVVSQQLVWSSDPSLTTRHNTANTDTVSFDVALQYADGNDDIGQDTETIGYVAVDAGSNGQYEAKTTAGIVSSSTSEVTYDSSFSSDPAFFANVASVNDDDAVFLEYESRDASGIDLELKLAEQWDGETTHGNEQVNYLALSKDGDSQTLTGRQAPDKLYGIENLIGSDYDDTLTGSDVDNVITGGLGADAIDGQGGNDTADYSDSTEAIIIDLNDQAQSGGSADGDVLTSIENLTGSDYADALRGDGNANVLSGGLGDDTLTGRGGDDIFIASTDSDTITDFASGDLIDLSENWVDYNTFGQLTISGPEISGSTYTYSIYLESSTGAATLTMQTQGAYDWSADDFILADVDYSLEGTAQNDKLIGGRGDNLILGYDGSDKINGRGGDDFIMSGAGDLDIMNGGCGEDTFYFGIELHNGLQERNKIKDFDVAEDAIDLSGSELVRYKEKGHSVLLWAGEDRDIVVMRGVAEFDDITFL
ncbi:MAG: hypothetical protein AAGG56_03015 [Pseudomonadota bacterium]